LENASKALVMAGAVLITIMVFGMAMYFMLQFKEFPEQQEEALRQKQISEFNQEYESYNKQKMYGVDVVTVINKAINNNKTYAHFLTGEYRLGDNNHYIDVQVILKSPIQSYAIQYYEDTESYDATSNNDKLVLDRPIYDQIIYEEGSKKQIKLGDVWQAREPITLLTFAETKAIMNEKMEEFFKGFDSYKIRLKGAKKIDEFNYTVVYSGFTDFKRRFFQCTEVQYDPETARVSKLVFEEIRSSESEE